LTNAAIDQATADDKSKTPAIPTLVGYGFSDGAVDISGQARPSFYQKEARALRDLPLN
jgi:hypothetical protein